MSSVPVPGVGESVAHAGRLSRAQLAGGACVLAILGITSISPTVFGLWDLWTSDALKSIGMAVPLVSLVLILMAWRRLEWEMDGSWWGLAILVLTVGAVRLREQALLTLVLSPHWSTLLPPLSLVAFGYGSGVVLLLGGTRLYRAALFPIVLLWFVNPVPRAFSLLIDLPLQHASAHIARGFAMALGQPLTPDKLRLMFTPEFGMFIAPGCNGIRGAVTMGFIALVAGYVYRFRWHAHTLVVVGAVLLGYVFNLLRLCALVLYYLVALHIPWLQPRAEMGDYIIGAILFLVATLLLFYVIERLKGAARPVAEVAVVREDDPPSRVYARIASLALILLFGFAGLPRARAAFRASQVTPLDAADALFPDLIGGYHRVRTWNETLTTGAIVYAWAQYAPGDGGVPIDIGVSPVLGAHDVLVCHSARGEDPLWRSEETVTTAGNVPVRFGSAFFTTGTSQYLEVSTVCTSAGCGEFSTERTHFGLVYSRPDAATLLSPEIQRPIPVLLRAETIDVDTPADTARDELSGAMRGFLASVNLDDLTRPYRR